MPSASMSPNRIPGSDPPGWASASGVKAAGSANRSKRWGQAPLGYWALSSASSANIAASWMALEDAVAFGLLRAGRAAGPQRGGR